MIRLTAEVQKVGRLGTIKRNQIHRGHGIARAVANDSSAATFDVDVPEAIFAGNALLVVHLTEITIHDELLLAVVRVMIDPNFCVVCAEPFIVGEYEWIDLKEVAVSLDEHIIEMLHDEREVTFLLLDLQIFGHTQQEPHINALQEVDWNMPQI